VEAIPGLGFTLGLIFFLSLEMNLAAGHMQAGGTPVSEYKQQGEAPGI
jgi:hypothetical protein